VFAHLAWRLTDFFEEYDPAAFEPAPPTKTEVEEDDADPE